MSKTVSGLNDMYIDDCFFSEFPKIISYNNINPTPIKSNNLVDKEYVDEKADNIQTQIDNIITVNGTTPIFSINPTITLASGNCTVDIDNDDIANPILTFSLARGAKGDRGDRGFQGIDGLNGSSAINPYISIGSVTKLNPGNLPTVALDISSNQSNLVFNFGLVTGDSATGIDGSNGTNGNNGVSPIITIGTVSKLNAGTTPTVILDSLSTQSNPILNFGLVSGLNGLDGKDGKDGKDGEKGDQGEKGETGSQGSQGIAADVLSIANLLLSSTAIVVGGIVYTGLTSALTTMQLTIDGLIFKTQFMTANIFYNKTTFSSDLSVTNGIADQFKVTSSTGNVFCGELNSTYLSSSGNISGQKITSNNLVCPYYDYQSTTTASTINIGSNGLGFISNNINIGQKDDIIFINGVKYEAPIDTATSPTIKFVQQGFF